MRISRFGWISFAVTMLCACGSSGSGKKTWQCQVISAAGDICICADTGDPGTQPQPCPAIYTCCGLDNAPNSAGVTTCTCLPGVGTCTLSADVTSVPTCPPG
jgi:hypothetical protein